MFSVIFEVHPRPDQWDAYLGYAKMLRPELEQVDGFVDNIRYRSLTREGWILSLSGWRDEKALVRWRTQARHHDVQEKGRAEVLLDYHLRVGQVTQDTRLPDGYALHEQRLDETETGEGTTVTLIDARRPPEWVEQASPDEVATVARPRARCVGAGRLGRLRRRADARRHHPAHVLARPGRRRSLRGRGRAAGGARLRRVRVVRDYGMFDRREAPQYYPDVRRRRRARRPPPRRTGRPRPPRVSRSFLTASLVSSLIMPDSNVVAVSLPAIGRCGSRRSSSKCW